MVLFKTITMLVIISTNVQTTECTPQGKIETVPAIIDGELVHKSDWPWMVSIKVHHRYQTFNCGGSLIDPYWVVTAAHCLYKNNFGSLLPMDAFRVLVGAIDIVDGRSKGFETKIVDYIKYPRFVMQAVEKKNNDIALLKLKYRVPTKYGNPIELGSMDVPHDGDRCITMGWGCDHNSDMPVTTSRLFHVVLPVIPMESCSKKFQELINGNTRTKVCAGYFNKSIGICSGDSGGPLVCRKDGKWVLSGIVSFTIKNAPAIFTRVSSYKKWIRSVIEQRHYTDHRHMRKRDEMMMERRRNLLAYYIRNRMNVRRARLNDYVYDLILFNRLVPYVSIKNLYGRNMLKV